MDSKQTPAPVKGTVKTPAPVKDAAPAPAPAQTLPTVNPTVGKVGALYSAVGADGLVRPFRLPAWAAAYADKDGNVPMVRRGDPVGWHGSNGHKSFLATVYTVAGIPGAVLVERPDYSKGIVRYTVSPKLSAEAIA